MSQPYDPGNLELSDQATEEETEYEFDLLQMRESEEEEMDEDYEDADEDEDDEDEDETNEEEESGRPGAVFNIAQGVIMEALGRSRDESITQHELVELIQQNPMRIRALFQSELRRPRYVSMDDDDEDETYQALPRMRRGSNFPKVPSDAGRALMDSGDFGTNDFSYSSLKSKKQLGRQVMMRELGLGSPGKQKSVNRLISQNLMPQAGPDLVVHYEDKCYSGQFSDDGNMFYVCTKDFNIFLYDTSNPYAWKFCKTTFHPYGQWTITDATLSPDNRFIASSTIRNIVSLAPVDPNDTSDPQLLDFAEVQSDRRGTLMRSYGFGIWSIRFSGDGREIVAGTNNESIYVYDLEMRKSTLRIRGHTDDVNAVSYGDKNSPHILYSGSDDCTVKVWDRRSLSGQRPAGVFIGHTEGLTYVDSKGDGRYVLSNGKDQTMRLWDLRKMMSTEESEKVDNKSYSTSFDYRWETYDDSTYRPHPKDCSVVTFRGHRVVGTLIRCHFSPPGSTDSRYVYSGSADGKVFIYNLDATVANTIDVREATDGTRPRERSRFYQEEWSSFRRGRSGWRTCVREASWHPYAPVIAATSWNGWGSETGSCTVHTWNDGYCTSDGQADDEAEPRVGLRVNPFLKTDRRFYDLSPELGAPTARREGLRPLAGRRFGL